MQSSDFRIFHFNLCSAECENSLLHRAYAYNVIIYLEYGGHVVLQVEPKQHKREREKEEEHLSEIGKHGDPAATSARETKHPEAGGEDQACVAGDPLQRRVAKVSILQE